MNHATMEEWRMMALWATLQPARLAHPSSGRIVVATH
jgi:hypothetical protein